MTDFGYANKNDDLILDSPPSLIVPAHISERNNVNKATNYERLFALNFCSIPNSHVRIVSLESNVYGVKGKNKVCFHLRVEQVPVIIVVVINK